MNRFFIVFVIIFFLGFCLGAYALGKDERAVYYSEKRDPFIPLVDAKWNFIKNFKKPQVEELATKVSLTGISKIRGKLYAILDGELVKEGDMFGEFTVEKIDPERVILSFGDKKFELRLEPEKKE